jgi:hypothetical protein
MSAIIAALASYLTADLLTALLVRTGLFGSRAGVAARRLTPVVGRILRRLQERRDALPEDVTERQELDEEIAALSKGEVLSGGR